MIKIWWPWWPAVFIDVKQHDMDRIACKWMTDRGAENFQRWRSLTRLARSFWQICASDHPPQELEQQFERERLSLEEQKTLLRQQLEELREELTSKLTAANEEVGHQTWHTAADFVFMSVSKVFGKRKATIAASQDEFYWLSVCYLQSFSQKLWWTRVWMMTLWANTQKGIL